MQLSQTLYTHKLIETIILKSATFEDVNPLINSYFNEFDQSLNHELREEFERATRQNSLSLVEQFKIIKEQTLASQILTPQRLIEQPQNISDFRNLGLVLQNYSQDQNMDSLTSDDDPLESTHGSYTQQDSTSQCSDKQQVHKKSHNKTRTDTIWKKTLRAFRLSSKNQFLKIVGRKLTPAQFSGSPQKIAQQIVKVKSYLRDLDQNQISDWVGPLNLLTVSNLINTKKASILICLFLYNTRTEQLNELKDFLFEIQGDSYENLVRIYHGIYGNTHNSQDRVQFFNDDLNKILFERWMALNFDSFIENLPQGKYFKDELINFLKDLKNYGVSYRLSHIIKQMTSNGPKKRGRPCKASPTSSERISTGYF